MGYDNKSENSKCGKGFQAMTQDKQSSELILAKLRLVEFNARLKSTLIGHAASPKTFGF